MTLTQQENLDPVSDAFTNALAGVAQRQAEYEHFRLYPELPDWEVMVSTAMSKRRRGADNWYLLDFATRQKVDGPVTRRVGRRVCRRVSTAHHRLVAASTTGNGRDAVAHQVDALKEIVYESRCCSGQICSVRSVVARVNFPRVNLHS